MEKSEKKPKNTLAFCAKWLYNIFIMGKQKDNLAAPVKSWKIRVQEGELWVN